MSDKFDKLQAKVVAIMCEWRPPAAAAIQRGVFGAMGQLTEALGADHSCLPKGVILNIDRQRRRT
jgi:hypothetical protein